MGPPGSGKSFLGAHLARAGLGSYRELEPILREKFGAEDTFLSNKRAALEFLVRSYRDQLAHAERPVAIETTGVSDRPILEQLAREHRVAIAHVNADRAVCVDRVVARPPGRNISATVDRERVGAFYDLWHERIAPTYRFDLVLDGGDVEAATAALRRLLEERA